MDKHFEESGRTTEIEGKPCPNQLPIWNIVKRECSVLDCGNNSSKCSVFAFPECTSDESSRDKCRIWMKACGNASLLDLDLSKIHEEAFICSVHFDDNQFKDDTRSELLAIAVPSIHLPVQIPTDQLDECFAKFSSGSRLENGRQEKGVDLGDLQVKRESSRNVYPCPSCKKQFTDQEAADTHFKLIHCDEGPLECSLCDKTFIRGCDYRRHCRIHTTKMRYVCAECEKCFPSKAPYDRHIKASHSADSPFFCKPCNRRFSSKSCLNSHLRIHSDEKKFACTLCAKRFFTNGALKTHRLTHNSKDCKCEVCGKIYPDKATYVAHIKEHEKETPYACENCSRRFTSQKYLIIHMRTHSEISFNCKECKKRFSSEESLQLHMKSHLEAEPAICPHCKNVFSSLNRLVYHYCKSLRGKRNTCPVCSQQFSTRSVLEIHMVIHETVEEPNRAYACSVCYQRFRTKARLDSHITAEHDSDHAGGSRHVETSEYIKPNASTIPEIEPAEAEEGNGMADNGDENEEEFLMQLEDNKFSIKLEPAFE